jgi:hypothetical protein
MYGFSLQSMDILEKIFLWLCPRDLALLCLTSKKLHEVVMQFVDHQGSILQNSISA